MDASKDALILQKSLQFIPFRGADNIEVVNRGITRMLSWNNNRSSFQQFVIQAGMFAAFFIPCGKMRQFGTQILQPGSHPNAHSRQSNHGGNELLNRGRGSSAF